MSWKGKHLEKLEGNVKHAQLTDLRREPLAEFPAGWEVSLAGAATSIFLSRQNFVFWRDNYNVCRATNTCFVATKMILVAALANDMEGKDLSLLRLFR